MTHVLNSVPVLKTSRASTARKRRKPKKRKILYNVTKRYQNIIRLTSNRW